MTLPIVALARRLFSKIEPPKTITQETTKMTDVSLTSLIAEANSTHDKIRQFAISRRQHRQALNAQAQGLLNQIKQADADVAAAEAVVGSTAGATPVAGTPHATAGAAVAAKPSAPAPAPVVSTSHNGSQG